MNVPEEIQNLTPHNNIKEEKATKNNNEISINYVITRKNWSRTNVLVDSIFAYRVSLDILSENENLGPKFVEECQRRLVFMKISN